MTWAGVGGGQVPVWPVTCSRVEEAAPLALGMVLSAVGWFEGGRLLERFGLELLSVDADTTIGQVVRAGRPGVLLASNYFWTLPDNLALAAEVKRLQPGTVCVFGGPSAPKYEGDAEGFLRDHPCVDVLVRGEGEITACELLAALDASDGDVAGLADVAGLTFRVGDRFVRTSDRARMTDLNVIPSPYLTGVFDHLAGSGGIWTVETNRGCPYGCTFCDWGSATNSRVRKFDLDRVKGELEWLAVHGDQTVFIADANFGMFARDVEIADYIAELHDTHGAPSSIIVSFAKNTTKYTVPIVSRLVASGIMAEATISFQTVDSATLVNIDRKNIKLSAYRDLANDLRELRLPILADVMLGLPGATPETLKTDLQACIADDVTARVFATFVLPNSPMNDPEYRARHQIVTDEAGHVVASSSFSIRDYAEMLRIRDVLRLADHFGVLRHVMRYVAHVTGRREVDVVWQMFERTQANPDVYPISAFYFLSARRYLNVPLSWSLFYAEIDRLCREMFDMDDDQGFATVMAIQEALMPTPGRSYPFEIELEHDYPAFFSEVIRPTSGVEVGRALQEYPPVTVMIDDPRHLSVEWIEQPKAPVYTEFGLPSPQLEGSYHWNADFELVSPVAREIRRAYEARVSTRPETVVA